MFGNNSNNSLGGLFGNNNNNQNRPLFGNSSNNQGEELFGNNNNKMEDYSLEKIIIMWIIVHYLAIINK